MRRGVKGFQCMTGETEFVDVKGKQIAEWKLKGKEERISDRARS